MINPCHSTGCEAENKDRQDEPAMFLKSRNRRKSANYFRIDDPGRGTKGVGRWTHRDWFHQKNSLKNAKIRSFTEKNMRQCTQLKQMIHLKRALNLYVKLVKALISHWKLCYILDNFLSCHHCLSSR